MLKKLEIIIKPGKLDSVKNAMAQAGYKGVTVAKVEGHGSQKGLVQKQNGDSYRLDLLPKVRLEVVVEDKDLESLIEAISGAARTGEPGDGKIFVTDVADVIRIRTGERGAVAV